MAGVPFGKIPVDPWVLVVLLYNLWEANKDPEIGHGDPRYDEYGFLSHFRKGVWVGLEDVESLLWSANMLNERGKFWHPGGKSFTKFVQDGFPRMDFDVNTSSLVKKSKGKWAWQRK